MLILNKLGVTSSAWYKSTDGSSSNVLEYTSCVGAQKKILLSKLSTILSNYFKIYYDIIADSKLTSDLFDETFHKAIKWIELFCS